MKKPRSIRVIGRRWFQKTHGNTYHTAEVFVDGERVHKTSMEYGYGHQYEETAWAWLEAAGYLPGAESYGRGGHECLWRYCDRNGIEYSTEVHDGLKREL